tara:strand:+ start:90 stop:587 length:498 start_codon:yes stop_codon:yes gene_type:complete
MILSCNSCEKKFVVPDQAITAAGRMVQCGSCGNRWKQYPEKSVTDEIAPIKKIDNKKISKKTKIKKNPIKKIREINLYSPEYLAKKHGIILDNTNNKSAIHEKVSFGFYNSLILFIVVIIALSKGLHFFQDFIILNLPFTEFYLNYFFENIRNLFEIWKSLISNY